MKERNEVILWLGLIGILFMIIGCGGNEIVTADNQKSISAIIVAIIAGIVGFLTGILTHYWTKKREVQASLRLRQSEVYNEFMEKTIVKLMPEVKHDQFQQGIDEDLQDYMIGFVGELIVWGSSSVIHAYRRFQVVAAVSVPNPRKLFSSLDNLLLEIRKDLGHNNKDLKQYDLYNLFLKGDIDIAEEIRKLEDRNPKNILEN